ncbi:MAG: hypothetical protein JWO78_2420 [Micavibrio sp.]|nr:hypothetical protein [Micavibrio sp.]
MSNISQFAQAASQSLTIRFSTPADTPSVLAYYGRNPNANVDFRGDDVFTDRTDSGRTILVFKPDNSIGLSSMSHPYPDQGLVEIGSTLANMDGFGLYPFIIASQIVHEFLERTPDEKFFACIYKPENDSVTKMLNTKVGWHIVAPCQVFADSIGETENINRLSWLNADSDTLPHQARVVLETVLRGTVSNKKTGETLKLDLGQFSLATVFSAKVEELANGRFGEMLEKSHHLPLKQAKAAFDRYQQGATYFPELSPKP